MTDTPLYDATLADVLARARREADLARSRWELAERRADERAEQAERDARLRIAQVEREAAAQVARAQAYVAAETARLARQDRVREALAEQPVDEPTETPTVPSLAELRAPAGRVSAFFDAVLGPSGP